MFNTIYIRKESVNYKCKYTFDFLRIGLVGTEEITNIRLQVCKFELLINVFYDQSASLFSK